MEEYDFLILGGGAAGFAAAIQASHMGRRTAMVERGTIGGTCVNVGCVPSKHLISAAEAYYYARRSNFSSFSLRGKLDAAKMVKQKDDIVSDLRKARYEDVLAGLLNVSLIRGQAAFTGPDTVSVDGHEIRAARTLIATGSSPHVPEIPGLAEAGYLTNVEALSPKAVPKRLLVIGGRALGLEIAQMYAHLGSEVTVFQRSARLLPDEEPEIGETLAAYLRGEGVEVFTGAVPERVESADGEKVVHMRIGDGVNEFRGDEILMATGRRPNTADLKAREAGILLGPEGEVVVNAEMQTSLPHVFAAGDVTGKPMLETVAAREGYVAAVNAFGVERLAMDFSAVPHAVFTTPQVASVGLTEEQMMAKYNVCACRTVPMTSVPKAALAGDDRGLIKMVIHPETKRILGVHILAPLAADMIHEAVLAVKFGLTVDDLIHTVHVFPTYSEGLKIAALSFYADVDKLSCCAV